MAYTALWNYYSSFDDNFDMGKKKGLYYLEKCYNIRLNQHGKYHQSTLINTIALSRLSLRLSKEKQALKFNEESYEIAEKLNQLDP